MTAVTVAGGVLLPVDQPVLEVFARGRAPALTKVMLEVDEVGQDLVLGLGWAVILVLLVFRQFRRLIVFLGTFWLVQTLTTYLANGILEQASPLRPAGIAVLGQAGLSAYPLVPIATLTARLVGVLYTLVPQGRMRQVGKVVVAAIVAVVAVARLYLVIDTPTGILVAVVIGVTIPLVAFRLLCPDEVFPVTYRRGRAAHLDVGGRRGEGPRSACSAWLDASSLMASPSWSAIRCKRRTGTVAAVPTRHGCRPSSRAFVSWS